MNDYAATALLIAVCACATPEPHTRYCVAVSGFDQGQRDAIRLASGQWIAAGFQQVSCDEPHDRRLRVVGAHLEGRIGRSLGQRIELDYGLDGDCLKLAAVHEVGHSLARSSGHAEPGSGVMAPSPGCSEWLLTGNDVEWLRSKFEGGEPWRMTQCGSS